MLKKIAIISVSWVVAAGIGWGSPYITYPQRAVGSVYFGNKSCRYNGGMVVCNFSSLEDVRLYVVCVDEHKRIEGMSARIGFSQVSLQKGWVIRACGLQNQLVGIFKSSLLAEAYISKYSSYYQQVTE